MAENRENIDNWIKFLNPENLKDNLMFSSLYIATFEAFKDYVVDWVFRSYGATLFGLNGATFRDQ